MLGKIEGRKRTRRQRMRQLDGIINSTRINLSKFWEMVKDREDWCAVVQEVSKSQTEMLNNNILRISFLVLISCQQLNARFS